MTFLAHPRKPETPGVGSRDPGAETKPDRLLSIPNYHYDWQQNYRWTPGRSGSRRGRESR